MKVASRGAREEAACRSQREKQKISWDLQESNLHLWVAMQVGELQDLRFQGPESVLGVTSDVTL